MYFVLFCNLIAVFLTYLEVKGNVKNGTKIGFGIITLVACLHYDFGSDYSAYFSTYKEIASYDFDLKLFLSGDVYRNPGWTILNWLFKYLGGFFALIAVLNLIQNVIYYKLIDKYTSGYQKVFAVFLYLFLANYYMMNFSMMRQGFVIACFVALWPWIRDRKWLQSLGVIFILSFIHNSAAILYPFAFWGFMPLKNTKPFSVFMVSILILLYVSKELVGDVFNRMMVFEDFQSFAERYEETNTQGNFGLGALIQLFPVIFTSIFLFKNEEVDNEIKSIVALSLIGSVATPFNSVIILIGRIGLYFSAFSIVAIPIVFKSISNKTLRLGVVSLYVLITAYNINIYYSQADWNMDTYHTIFEAL